jgi:hypothetical protein
MTQPGLSLEAPDLVDAVRSADDERRRRAALAGCRFAVERNGLAQEPAIADALRALTAGAVGDVPERQAVRELTEQLDNAAWAIQERVEAGEASDADYIATFKRARAAAAVEFAFEADAETAAMESLYEAHHATQDLDRLRAEVIAALA